LKGVTLLLPFSRENNLLRDSRTFFPAIGSPLIFGFSLKDPYLVFIADAIGLEVMCEDLKDYFVDPLISREDIFLLFSFGGEWL
jgi:hypothetical protein